MLNGLVKPFPRYGKAINAVVLLAFVMLVVAGAGAALTVHNKKPQTVVLKQASSTNKPVSKPAATPTTQPAQTSTPSTPATTTKPKPDSSVSVTCQTEDIPYTTTTQYVPNEYNTYTYDEGGFNGSEMVCSDGTTEDVTPPDNKVIYVGAIDRAAQDLAAYNKINASCSENNPTAAQFYTCTQTDENFYTVYASQSSTAAENFLNTLP